MTPTFAPLFLLVFIAPTVDPPTSAKPKTAHRLPHAPGMVEAHQDIDLIADDETHIQLARSPAGRPPASARGRTATVETGGAELAALKIGQAIKIVLVPKAAVAAGKKTSSTPNESVLVGTVQHLDAKHRKLTVRTEWLALRGMSRKQHLNKDYVKQLLADWRVSEVQVLEDSEGP